MVAEYFYQLNSWLNANFGGLKKISDWELLYIRLVKILVALRPQEMEMIDVNKIIMPIHNDIFQACRLMYQAIVPLRTGFADGQHRVAAMVELLGGWKIKVDITQTPPRSFARDASWSDQTHDFDKLLQTLSSDKVLVRIVETDETNLEIKGVEYSQMREKSQSLHKPRVLVDV